MTTSLREAVAAGVMGSEEAHQALRSIVEVARAIFRARASSIFLLDEEGRAGLRGGLRGRLGSPRRDALPRGTGIAGWVLVTRQALVLEDVASDQRFAREVAEETGYVPNGLMAVPLLHEERALGVLEVLDRPNRSRFTLAESDLLGLFANQAAIALDLLQSGRRARAALTGASGEEAVVAKIASALAGLEGEERAAGLRLLTALEEVLRRG